MLVCAVPRASAQTLAALEGRVLDPTGASIPAAIVTVRDAATGFTVAAPVGTDGRYHIGPLPAGSYTVTAEAPAFRSVIVEQLAVDVGRTVVRDFTLLVGDRAESVVVRADAPLVDRATATVGNVVTRDTIQDIPLNGRHFMDLGPLVPGGVAPSQTGFSSRPIRGVGSLAFNVAGNREEAVAYVVNGVTTNNLTFGSLIFEPPLGAIQEFKADTSGLNPEHGHVSGAIVNIVTRSGTDSLHGDAYDFARNSALDARNFFEATSQPHPFRRQQFGGSVGGPIKRGQTFFFGVYEGFRQHQEVDLNSLVPTDAQRASVTDPIVLGLLPLIPHATAVDAAGNGRYIGSAPADVNIDRWTVDIRHRLRPGNSLEGFFGGEYVDSNEPTSMGNSIPGFGQVSHPSANILTITDTQVYGSHGVNELRFGRNKLNGGTYPASTLNPSDYGIRDGVIDPIGLPQMIVAGDLNFGGPGPLPQGRHDTSYILNDTYTYMTGRHALKFGGEYRYFINDNFAQGTGTFNFPTMNAFLTGTANAFTTTLGLRTSLIHEPATSFFAQDRLSAGDRLTIELGLRYEWHVTPTEQDDKFVVFDAATASLVRVGVDVPRIYRQNNLNFEPRLGIVWDALRDGRTVLRAAYTRTVDQPGTTAVRDTAGNPPYGVPLTASGPLTLASAIDATMPVGLAPSTVDPNFRNASLQSWNVNVQRQIGRDAAVTIGYQGSAGSNLRITANINAPVNGVRPFPAVSASSPILPGTPLGNIMQVESAGFSTYHGGWISFTKRLSRGLQVDASYTRSKSLDTNSLNSTGFAIQNPADIANEYGLSDFDARNRFVLSGSYSLPFRSHVLTRGWQLAVVAQSQSGNPVNIVTSTSSVNGLPNTVRPNVTGPIRIVGSVNEWFDPSVFTAVNGYGSLGRNVVIGPGFNNVDLSATKDFRFAGGPRLQFRADVFDVFNHPNFGPPGNIVGSPTFGMITRTRLPTGEAGSSRQIQLAVRMAF
jgi:Carboxypeptidase regulatory-like domain